jgi:hypothetical protein
MAVDDAAAASLVFTAPGFRTMARRQGWDIVHLSHPGKRVPLSLMLYQLQRMLDLVPHVPAHGTGIAVPVNLGDAMLLMLRRTTVEVF